MFNYVSVAAMESPIHARLLKRSSKRILISSDEEGNQFGRQEEVMDVSHTPSSCVEQPTSSGSSKGEKRKRKKQSKKPAHKSARLHEPNSSVQKQSSRSSLKKKKKAGTKSDKDSPSQKETGGKPSTTMEVQSVTPSQTGVEGKQTVEIEPESVLEDKMASFSEMVGSVEPNTTAEPSPGVEYLDESEVIITMTHSHEEPWDTELENSDNDSVTSTPDFKQGRHPEFEPHEIISLLKEKIPRIGQDWKPSLQLLGDTRLVHWPKKDRVCD